MDFIEHEGRPIRNAVEEAVYVVFHGARSAAERLGVSTQQIFLTLGAGMVQQRRTALKWADATAAAGCEVPAAELMALTPWQGPARHPGAARHTGAAPKGRRRGAPPPSGFYPIPTPADAHLAA